MPLHHSPEVEEVVAAQVVEGAVMTATVAAVVATTRINYRSWEREDTASGLNNY